MISSLLLVSACGPGDTIQPDLASDAREPSITTSHVTHADIPSDVFEDSWARLPLLNRAELDAEGQHRYDVIVNPDSRYADDPWGPVAMWMYSPLIIEHIFPASTYLRFVTQKDPRLTELAILSTAREVRSQYEWGVLKPAAVAAGLEPEIVDIVKHRTPLDAVDGVPGLGERERTIIQFVREVVSDERLSSPTFAQALALFSDKDVMNLAGLVGYYNFVNITLKTFDIQLEPGRERRLPDLW